MVVDQPQPSSSEPIPAAEPSKSVVLPNSSAGGLPGGDMHFRADTHTAIPTPMLALTAPSSSNVPEPEINAVPLDENSHHYVGLVNQAMTCYLNSLVQTLYMTPEFRNAIYRWEYKSQGKGGGESSIPCQIQKLFLMLQTTDREVMETTDLTASFGWTSNEAYDQHDVQELCRLMFDALEHRWKGSAHDKLIQNLYRGTMQDFVKCLSCGKENVRQDFFLDLPLALKPFGVPEAYKSVEEALSAFIAPEKLEGGNQYNCESCNAKRDAHKGLRITQFPYLLTIQLKRFDFDYNTMHRIKLNDKMTFPDILNLNPYIYDPANPDKEIDSDEVLYTRKPTVGLPLNAEEITRLLKQGEYVYELFSVMVHQGSAAGGHYYAYIKNLDQDKWYCFNDTRVEFASYAEIEKSYGGMQGGWSNSNTNAYMLMYRKVRDKRNEKFIRTDKLPSHIVQLQNHWVRLEEDKQRQRDYQASLVYVTIQLNIPCEHSELILEPFKTEIPRTSPLSELINAALKFFDERAARYAVPLYRNKMRLIRLNSNEIMTQCFVSKKDYEKKLENILTINELRDNVKELNFLFDFPLPNNPYAKAFSFIENDFHSRTIQVSRVDITSRTVYPAVRINVTSQDRGVIQVKTMIGAVFGDDQRASIPSRLVLQISDQYSRNFKILDMPAASFRDILRDAYMNVPLIYYDGGVPITPALEADRKKTPEESEMFKILDRKKFAVTLNVRLPNEDEIAKTNVFCSSFAGPSWVETVSPSESIASSPCTASEDVEEVMSGRSSNVSMTDDAIGSDSFCNNTPAMSPAVSETDEGYEESNLSKSRSIGVWDLASTMADPVETSSEYYVNDKLPKEADSVTGSTTSTLVISSADCGHNIVYLSRSEKNIMTLDVDKRIPVSELKQWLSEKLKIDAVQFQICTHHTNDYSDRGYDYTGQDDESLNSAFSGSTHIDLKLRPPLKQDEKLIKVFLVDLEDMNKDNWKQLFEIPASKSTVIGDFLLQCHRLYNELYQSDISYKQVRLRDVTNTMKTVLNPDQSFEQCRQLHQWSNNVYFHVIREDLIGKKGEPIFVRRFRPATVEYGPIQEIVVDLATPSSNQWDLLKQAIAEISAVPLDHVEITEPATSAWDYGKWPYLKNRLEMLDGNVKFFAAKPASLIDQFIHKIGNRVIYYKDNREVAKELTDDERKQITIKDNSVANTVQRRRERPLRIQMSSICEP